MTNGSNSNNAAADMHKPQLSRKQLYIRQRLIKAGKPRQEWNNIVVWKEQQKPPASTQRENQSFKLECRTTLGTDEAEENTKLLPKLGQCRSPSVREFKMCERSEGSTAIPTAEIPNNEGLLPKLLGREHNYSYQTTDVGNMSPMQRNTFTTSQSSFLNRVLAGALDNTEHGKRNVAITAHEESEDDNQNKWPVPESVLERILADRRIAPSTPEFPLNLGWRHANKHKRRDKGIRTCNDMAPHVSRLPGAQLGQLDRTDPSVLLAEMEVVKAVVLRQEAVAHARALYTSLLGAVACVDLEVLNFQATHNDHLVDIEERVFAVPSRLRQLETMKTDMRVHMFRLRSLTVRAIECIAKWKDTVKQVFKLPEQTVIEYVVDNRSYLQVLSSDLAFVAGVLDADDSDNHIKRAVMFQLNKHHINLSGIQRMNTEQHERLLQVLEHASIRLSQWMSCSKHTKNHATRLMLWSRDKDAIVERRQTVMLDAVQKRESQIENILTRLVDQTCGVAGASLDRENGDTVRAFFFHQPRTHRQRSTRRIKDKADKHKKNGKHQLRKAGGNVYLVPGAHKSRVCKCNSDCRKVSSAIVARKLGLGANTCRRALGESYLQRVIERVQEAIGEDDITVRDPKKSDQRVAVRCLTCFLQRVHVLKERAEAEAVAHSERARLARARRKQRPQLNDVQAALSFKQGPGQTDTTSATDGGGAKIDDGVAAAAAVSKRAQSSVGKLACTVREAFALGVVSKALAACRRHHAKERRLQIVNLFALSRAECAVLQGGDDRLFPPHGMQPPTEPTSERDRARKAAELLENLLSVELENVSKVEDVNDPEVESEAAAAAAAAAAVPAPLQPLSNMARIYSSGNEVAESLPLRVAVREHQQQQCSQSHGEGVERGAPLQASPTRIQQAAVGLGTHVIGKEKKNTIQLVHSIGASSSLRCTGTPNSSPNSSTHTSSKNEYCVEDREAEDDLVRAPTPPTLVLPVTPGAAGIVASLPDLLSFDEYAAIKLQHAFRAWRVAQKREVDALFDTFQRRESFPLALRLAMEAYDANNHDDGDMIQQHKQQQKSYQNNEGTGCEIATSGASGARISRNSSINSIARAPSAETIIANEPHLLVTWDERRELALRQAEEDKRSVLAMIAEHKQEQKNRKTKESARLCNKRMSHIHSGAS